MAVNMKLTFDKSKFSLAYSLSKTRTFVILLLLIIRRLLSYSP